MKCLRWLQVCAVEAWSDIETSNDSRIVLIDARVDNESSRVRIEKRCS